MSDEDDYFIGRNGMAHGNNSFAEQQGRNDRARWEEASARMDQASHSSWGGSSGMNDAGWSSGTQRSSGNSSGVPFTPHHHAPPVQPAAPIHGTNHNYTVTVDLLQAYRGFTCEVPVLGGNRPMTMAPGITDGYQQRWEGQGYGGINGGRWGDLVVTFRIKPHPLFQREGNDLHTTVEMDARTVAFGGDLLIPTLTGKVNISVEPDIHSKPQLRLRGKGFPVQGKPGVFGDLLVTFTDEVRKKEAPPPATRPAPPPRSSWFGRMWGKLRG